MLFNAGTGEIINAALIQQIYAAAGFAGCASWPITRLCCTTTLIAADVVPRLQASQLQPPSALKSRYSMMLDLIDETVTDGNCGVHAFALGFWRQGKTIHHSTGPAG